MLISHMSNKNTLIGTYIQVIDYKLLILNKCFRYFRTQRIASINYVRVFIVAVK